MFIQYEPNDEKNALVVTGLHGESKDLLIPVSADTTGRTLPVTEISANAFSGRKDLVSVSIPKSVTRIGAFAFFNLPFLRSVQFSDSVQDLRDGNFRQCPALEEITLSLRTGSFRLLKDLLADLDRRISFCLKLPDRTLLLTFPPFVDSFEEDTMSRAIHEHIEGCGYEYRQTVSRDGIRLSEYDNLFPRCIAADPIGAEEIALGRLKYPYQLSTSAEKMYRQYLSAHGSSLLRHLLSEESSVQEDKGYITKDPERLRNIVYFLSSERLLSADAIRENLSLLSQKKDPEISAVLLSMTRSSESRDDEFDL